MAVRLRLTRIGGKKDPVWRVVVADQRSPRDGRIIESIGHYNPQTEPSTIRIDRERLQHWIDLGARPTNTVLKLMRAPDTVAVSAPAPVTADEPEAEAASTSTAVAEAPAADEPAVAADGDSSPDDAG